MTLNMFDTAAILLVLAAFFGYLNHRFLRLPFTIGLMLSGLVASLAVLLVDALVPSLGLGESVRGVLGRIDFHETLMHGMLGFLLFAGALHVDINDLAANRGPILALASIGVVISTALIGIASFLVFRALGVPVPLPYCLVFGALISPTDPIAVMGMLKSMKAPRRLEVRVAGESLFNDGVGVVLFSVLLTLATGRGHGGDLNAAGVVALFAREILGGIALGFVAGLAVYRAMKRLNEPNLEVLLSIALVMGITFVAFRIHASAPLACVVAGLLIGNHGRAFAMADETREALDLVWAFIDETLNAVLFLLVGLEVIEVVRDPLNPVTLEVGLLLIPVALAARFVSVALPVSGLRFLHDFTPGAVQILTWGGLRGGISLALALSLRDYAVPGYDTILTATYAIVVFSIVAQGLTIGRLIRRYARGAVSGA